MTSPSKVSRIRKPPAYTRTGDEGETGLIGGRRVRKSSQRVRAYGQVDELNSAIGVAIEFTQTDRVKRILRQVQRDLFVMGSELASPQQNLSAVPAMPRVSELMLSRIESETDKLHEELPVLRNFILPGGSQGAAFLHLSRAIARRAEREVVALAEIEALPKINIRYLNRLSSLLFELARYENSQKRRDEEVWSGKSIRDQE